MKKIKNILFDLDGTLLPMDQDQFIKRYLGGLVHALAKYGYEPGELADTIMYGTACMIKNNGASTNENVFWNTFEAKYPGKRESDTKYFDEFYANEFDKVSEVTECDPMAAKIISRIKELGYKVVLATNPVFPEVATRKRAAWAGLNIDEFDYFTSYENSSFCKPNPKYYLEITEKLGLDPEECLMVGNDVDEDMITETLGMKTFLIPRNLINRSGKDISAYNNGDFSDLIAYIESL